MDRKEIDMENCDLRFGVAAVKKGFTTRHQILIAMAVQFDEDCSIGHHRFIGQILVDGGLITTEQCAEVLETLRMPDKYRALFEKPSESSYRNECRVRRTLSVAYNDSDSFVKASMINASTDNLSVGGLFIETEEPFEKGEEFFLDLQLPGSSKPITISCEVAWVREAGDMLQGPPGMGAKFCRIDEEEQQILTRYVNEEMFKE
ncbi:MAG: PilZ domain-containing protein [Desulfobacteraceae bacterium]|jgi:type IV pilus assembly protein PilZ